MSFFELSDDDKYIKRNEKPIWKLLKDKASDQQILDWLNSEFDFLFKEAKEKHRDIRTNLALFKGIQYKDQEVRSSSRDKESDKSKYAPRVVVNYLKDLTEQRVAGMVKYKPAVAILPADDEYSDKTSATIAKNIVDYILYCQDYESKNALCVRLADVAREAYLTIKWNPDLGPKHPDFDEDEKIPLLDKEGNELKDDKGKARVIEEVIRIGDVELKVKSALHILIQKAESYDDAQYGFEIERKDVDELKFDYPESEGQIKADSSGKYFDFSKMEDQKLHNQCFVITFTYKKNKYLPAGRHIKFTKDVILENEDHKYDHGEFPWERLVGEEIPEEQDGGSFFTSAKPLASTYNNLTSMAVRNLTMVGHPKWFVPKGAINIQSLNNDISIVQYTGTVAPVLAQANPSPPELYSMREGIKEEMRELSQASSVARGEVPPGVTAGVALQYIGEQENDRANARVLVYNAFQIKVPKKVLKVAAQFYQKDDKRTYAILGKNKQWVNLNYDPKHLTRPFDIRLQNSSALPQSKGARTQYLLDMNQRFPNEVPAEGVIEMLDLGQADKFMNETTAAVRTAEFENEQMFNKEEVLAPEKYEMHIIHWRTHIKVIQDAFFKMKTPPEIQQAMIDHIEATEMLMWQAAQTSPLFGQQIQQQLPQWPIFFKIPPPPMPPQIPQGPVDPSQMQGIPANIPSDGSQPQPLPPDDFQPGPTLQPEGEPMAPPPPFQQ